MKYFLCGEDGIYFGTKVKVIRGFHKGREGVVIDKGGCSFDYDVKFNDGVLGKDIVGRDMEIIK